MDPNQMLTGLEAALAERDEHQAMTQADELAGWLKDGGKEPNWRAHPMAAHWLAARQVQAATVKRERGVIVDVCDTCACPLESTQHIRHCQS